MQSNAAVEIFRNIFVYLLLAVLVRNFKSLVGFRGSDSIDITQGIACSDLEKGKGHGFSRPCAPEPHFPGAPLSFKLLFAPEAIELVTLAPVQIVPDPVTNAIDLFALLLLLLSGDVINVVPTSGFIGTSVHAISAGLLKVIGLAQSKKLRQSLSYQLALLRLCPGRERVSRACDRSDQQSSRACGYHGFTHGTCLFSHVPVIGSVWNLPWL